MTKRPSIKAALDYAKTQVTGIYGCGYGQYTHNVWSEEHRAWWQGNGRPYSDAVMKRRDSIVRIALVHMGFDPEDADFGTYYEEGSARDIVARFVKKDDESRNAPTNNEFVVCSTADGYSLHAPGSTDEDIADGSAPALASGPWKSEARAIPQVCYDVARMVLGLRSR